MIKHIRHWIFDLDGTLTEPVHDFALIRQRLHIPEGADILAHVAGLPEPLRTEKTQQLDALEHFYALQARPAKGVVALITQLAAQGCLFGIVTRNTRPFAQLSLDAIGVGDYFPIETIIGRDEAQPKPDPQGIEALLNLWQVSASNVLMVGDYKYDLLAGRAAGCRTIHVHPDSTAGWPDLTDLRIASLDELQALL